MDLHLLALAALADQGSGRDPSLPSADLLRGDALRGAQTPSVSTEPIGRNVSLEPSGQQAPSGAARSSESGLLGGGVAKRRQAHTHRAAEQRRRERINERCACIAHLWPWMPFQARWFFVTSLT